jgi:hypothetical protein
MSKPGRLPNFTNCLYDLMRVVYVYRINNNDSTYCY